jgi:hypothetical protein
MTTHAASSSYLDCLTEPEWAEWFLLSPDERWEKSRELWAEYLALGGSLEPEVDFQSPFYTAEEYAEFEQHHADSLAQRRTTQP